MLTQQQIQDFEKALKDFQTSGNAQNFIDFLKNNIKLTDQLAQSLANSIKVQQQSVAQLQEEIKILKLMGEVTEANILSKREEIKTILDDIENRKTAGTITDDEIARLRKLIKTREEEINSIRAVESATKNFIVTTTGIDDKWKDTLIGSILNGDTQKNLETYEEAIKGQITNSNILGSTLMKIQEATITAVMEQDKAVSSFIAATGATAEYNSVIYETARGNTALGISFAESGKAVTELYTSLNTFTKLTNSAQQELTITTAKLEMLGISGTETANSIATLSQMMGVSEIQAAKTVEEFAAMGQAIGVSSKQMIADFAGVKDQLGVFGNEMNKVFTDLAAQSKATGVAVSDLLNLANKFDTFSSAADSVGKLNAMLGGPYLSTMAMIEATDPTERIDMLRQAVNNAGIAFDEMSYYEKKAIMEAGGFKTAEEAQRVLSMSAGDYAKQLENQKATQEELNNAIQRAQPIQDKLTKAMANFAVIMGPLVDIMSAFISDIVRFMDSGAFTFLKWAFLIGSALYGIANITTILSAAWTLLNLAFTASPLGAVIIGITALVYALWKLHDILFVPHSPVLVEVLQAMPEVFYSISIAIGAFAAAAMVLAATLPLMAVGLFSIMFALLGFANPLILLGVFNLSKALSTIVDQINEVETEKIVNFKVMMEKVVEISQPDNMAGFQAFKENFEAVVKATAEFEVKKAQSFTTLLTATQNLSQNLQLKQDIKVLIDSQAIAARIEKKQGNAATQLAT